MPCFCFHNLPQLTDAQSYHRFFNLTAICNECVLNVNNFYAFKQKILTAQAALSECADHEIRNEVNLIDIDTTETEMSDAFEDSNDPLNQMGKGTMLNQVTMQGQSTTDDGNRSQHTDDEMEIMILQESDAPDAVSETTEPTTNVQQKSPKIGAVAVKRRNPSKRKKVEDASMVTEKVAVQVNECMCCPAVLSDILELNEHTSTHATINCKVCNKSFLRYANLKRHFITAHSKPKPFVCDLCGLGFSFSVNLQTHASLHYSGKIQMKNANK